jgi:hypothetical protein
MEILINEGTFQEYDYNEETKECAWKQVHEKSNLNLKKTAEDKTYENEIIETDYHIWGG